MENVRFQEPYHRPATLGEWAAYYAASGLHVFPLVPRTKEPFKYSHGLHDATTDAEQVRRWWNQNPNANIGIACGPSGLLVIDCDVHPERNVDGLATLYGWEREHGELIETLVAITGSGSGHNVGLSQYGARAMAEDGYDYDEILEFYFTDIDSE